MREVNLVHGLPPFVSKELISPAEIGTYVVEFGMLSALTGDPKYMTLAKTAMLILWDMRPPVGLFPAYLDANSHKWAHRWAGIGSGVDSYYEYLVKGGLLFGDQQFLRMFDEVHEAIYAKACAS